MRRQTFIDCVEKFPYCKTRRWTINICCLSNCVCTRRREVTSLKRFLDHEFAHLVTFYSDRVSTPSGYYVPSFIAVRCFVGCLTYVRKHASKLSIHAIRTVGRFVPRSRRILSFTVARPSPFFFTLKATVMDMNDIFSFLSR